MSDTQGSHDMLDSVPVSGMFENWFLEYASYVILERAVPLVDDGLKPVQRRILHAMAEIDDGRFHKVANIIGQTMQYHPHGDAAIGDALVNIGQKNLLIDTQGNWGDNRTGDPAAAARYIEARLSPFAKTVAFNKDITQWQRSYDGRKDEPVALPMKFPILLALGVEGIAVGLSTKILPHNLGELCKAAIQVLKGKSTKVYPDFDTGGSMDASDYQQGKRGGKIRVRAHIEIVDKKLLAVRSVPYGTTTSSLVDSILKANDKGKIKIKKVVDNTAQDVELLVELPSGVSPDLTMDALYAFTDCEVSISTNACVIVDGKPRFMDTTELLRISTEHTRDLLEQELNISKQALLEKWHFASLEKIFIEERIYRDIEECETWEAVLQTIDKGLDPFKAKLNREVTEEDIVRLTEIKIKRISRFDAFKADENLKKLEDALDEVNHNLAHLTDYAISWFEMLFEKFGKARPRCTEIKSFEVIEARAVAATNTKLYANYADGFIGTGLKKDEFVCECSDIDDIIVFRRDGHCLVTRIADKTFVGKDILHVGVWKKGDKRMVYHMIYADIVGNKNYAKRFTITSITRDREYQLAKSDKAKVVYFSANPNSESEVVQVNLSSSTKARTKSFEYDFGDLAIKGREAKGNTLTKYAIRKVQRKELGASTLGGRRFWLDDTVGKLNNEERGRLLGEFDTDDAVLVLYKDGSYELCEADVNRHYTMDQIHSLDKFDPERIISAVYLDGERKAYYVKRFNIETQTTGQRFSFIGEAAGSKMVFLSTDAKPVMLYKERKGKGSAVEQTLNVADFIEVKGWKALGNKLGDGKALLGFKEGESEESEQVEVGKTIELDVQSKGQGSLFGEDN